MSRKRVSTRALERGQLESRVTSRAIAVLKIAEEIANTAKPVGKGLYEINPATILSLRESLRKLEDEGGITSSVSIRFRGFE
jgi:hypothetical protein